MNKVFLIGRLTTDPDIRKTQSDISIARYTLAVDRRYKRAGEPEADFIRCVAFGKGAEHAGTYYHKGTKIAVEGHIQTSSYVNRDGQKVFTTDIIVENQEFAESKKQVAKAEEEEFVSIPDGIDEDMPFH